LPMVTGPLIKLCPGCCNVAGDPSSPLTQVWLMRTRVQMLHFF
jgi:hypothetical protein